MPNDSWDELEDDGDMLPPPEAYSASRDRQPTDAAVAASPALTGQREAVRPTRPVFPTTATGQESRTEEPDRLASSSHQGSMDKLGRPTAMADRSDRDHRTDGPTEERTPLASAGSAPTQHRTRPSVDPTTGNREVPASGAHRSAGPGSPVNNGYRPSVNGPQPTKTTDTTPGSAADRETRSSGRASPAPGAPTANHQQPTIYGAATRQRREATTTRPNVDNVDTPRGAGPTGLVNRLRPFGQPLTTGRPQPRPSNVDNVDNGRGHKGGQDEASTEIGDTLRELDHLDALGALERAPEPMPSLTRLVEPGSGSRPMNAGPRGPSRDALEAVRRAAKDRLGKRARDIGIAPGSGAQPSRASASQQARSGTTVSQSTLDQYLRRGQLLFDRYRRELNIQVSAEELSPVEWVNWLLALKPGWKSSTWRMYRQSAYHFLEGFPGHETNDALGLLDADVIDRSRTPAMPDKNASAAVARRTSALKEKRFPIEDFERVTVYLRAFNRSKLAPVLVDWLRAGLLTGLRPGEWRACDIELREDRTVARGRRVWLYVLNAKATNGRGTGVVRTLDLSAFPDSDLECVQRMVDRGRRWLEEGQFAEMHANCSSLLYAATSKIWPNRRYTYALYSCRHQAIANWKAILRMDEIAAIVGHGITATSAENYGKRRSSWPPERIPVPPRPVPEELSQVRQRIRLFEDRIKLEQAAGLRRERDAPSYPVG